MTKSANAAYEQQARKALEEDLHYATTVARMAYLKEVFAAEEVFGADGLALLGRGDVVAGSVGERLLKNKLLKSIDESLMVADGVTPASLADAFLRLCDAEAYLHHLFRRRDDRLATREALATLELSAPMAFKLTVAREQRPDLFKHLLIVAALCHYLALRLRLARKETDELLLAALLHDLGELHTDPALLAQGRRVGTEEMRYVYAHPITGYLIAKAVAKPHPEVANAVLQHQERLDGSGYPYGLRADAVGRMARVVSVADVCASILERFGNSGRLSALMRLNHGKYDAELIALMQTGFGAEDDAADAGIAARPQLTAVADLLDRWGAFRASLTGGGGPPPELAFLFERMVGLNSMLLQFGFDAGSLQLLLSFADEDSRIAHELAAALNEMHWQFADLEREIVRHREAVGGALSAADNVFLEGWRADLHRYLEQAPPH